MTRFPSVLSFVSRARGYGRAHPRLLAGVAGGAALAVVAAIILAAIGDAPAEPAPTPSLTVTLASPQVRLWSETLEASGPIAAWQEAVIGSQVSGLRLIEVRVNVGDRVRRGQVLARFDASLLRAEAARLEAVLAEAEASAAQARADHARALSLAGSGAISDQEVLRYATAAATAEAASNAARAALEVQHVQLSHVEVRAPDDGVISARSATLGAVGGAGDELFRMIRQGRLEWRGELTPPQLLRVRPGQVVELSLPDGAQATARARRSAPALDPETRLGVLYADLTNAGSARAGMYAEGRVILAPAPAVVVPASGVVLRDGRRYVFRVRPEAGALRVIEQEVTVGRRNDGEIELVDPPADLGPIVIRGAGFLADGDLVQEAPPGTPPQPARAGGAR